MKASERKIVAGCSRLISAMSHSQKANGLVWGLSTRKIVHAALGPGLRDAVQRPPQTLPVARVEVDGIDVLVPFWRVLRTGDRAVRAMTEPGGVLSHPRMVRRTLERQVHGDVDPSPGRLARRAARSRRACPSSGAIASWPPAAAPIAQGLPTSPAPAGVRVPCPCERWSRSGGPAADRARRSRDRRRSPGGRRRRSSRPGRPGSGLAERGKSSYQLEKTARWGATIARKRNVAAPASS